MLEINIEAELEELSPLEEDPEEEDPEEEEDESPELVNGAREDERLVTIGARVGVEEEALLTLGAPVLLGVIEIVGVIEGRIALHAGTPNDAGKTQILWIFSPSQI